MPMTRMPSLNGFYQEKQEKEKAESGEENKVEPGGGCKGG